MTNPIQPHREAIASLLLSAAQEHGSECQSMARNLAKRIVRGDYPQPQKEAS